MSATLNSPIVFVLLALTCTMGCGERNQYQAPPPPVVTVAKPIVRTVTEYLEETGTTEAVQLVDVRARVRGFLEEVKFEPGTNVKKGDVLYQIEKTQYAAAVAAAQANLAARRVDLNKAQIELNRQETLFAKDATAETEVVAARAARDEATAAIKASEANLAQADLNLQYTDVVAAIEGRVGKTLVKQGNLVDGNEATHLTTIVKYDPIYANFNISESQLLALVDTVARNDVPPNEEGDTRNEIPLYLRRDNDAEFKFTGRFDYADLAVDQSTGTYMIRGIFDNPDRLIVPGLFVRVRIAVQSHENALLIPEYALASDQAGRYVLIVNDKNVVERLNVAVGVKEVFGAQPFVMIEQGLKPEHRVIVNGLQRARPDAEVAPNEKDLEAELAEVAEATPAGDDSSS